MIERFIDEGVKAYKRNSGNCLEATALNRHEPIVKEGHEFRYWREWAVYKMGQYITEIIPGAKVDVWMDGNDSSLSVELNDDEQKKLNSEMFRFFQELDAMRRGKVFI